MKFKYYFAKDFQTSDKHEIETLRTHYYRNRKEDVIDVVVEMAKSLKAKVKSVDEERGEIIIESPKVKPDKEENDDDGYGGYFEIIFDHIDYNACAAITAVSFYEIAVDFNVFTYNILPNAFGKKVIEKFYKQIDAKLEVKGIGLHR